MRRLCVLFLFMSCAPEAGPPEAGCGTVVVDPLADVTVESAHLENVELWQAGLFAGATQGRADLVIVGTNGEELDFLASLDGMHAGLVFDASTNVFFGDIPLTLPVGAAVNGRQLLGSYSGPHVGGNIGAGVQWRDLTNDFDVKILAASLSLGAGFTPLAWESIDLQLVNDPATVEDDDSDDGCGLFGCTPACSNDGFCDDFCDDDPDCDECFECGDCFADGFCDEDCSDDPDCRCLADDFCDIVCGDDPDCDDVEGETCAFFEAGARGSCSEGLACVRAASDDLSGVCRVPCGTLDDDGVATKDASVVCLEGRTCQRAVTTPFGEPDVVACLPQGAPGAACAAPGDVDACVGASCDIVPGFYLDESFAYGFRCREHCVPVDDGAGNVVASCTQDGQECVQRQRDDDRDGDIDISDGQCGVALPAPGLDDDPLDPAFRCNPTDALCDQSMFAGVDGAGVTTCVDTFQAAELVVSDVCFPFCAFPAIDLNGDGDADGDEDFPAIEMQCGAGFTCTGELGLALGVYFVLDDNCDDCTNTCHEGRCLAVASGCVAEGG